ncbi:MAG: isoleucine--tRNA ligase, partial [Armatimonadetes bacterium]|nr:isoleucine--tRNA ligase [Armatimonadota bacterium]
MDYKTTLNLLKTDFPMRGRLPEREPEILRWWEEIDVYRLCRERRAGAPRFILHDGPPYANGNIHLGQALNKILKDIALRYKTMRGYDCPFVPGWDTQGLPTEQAVEREYGLDRHSVSVLEWRAKCREIALKYVDIQREQFKRLGCRGDWDHPYLTLRPEYQARQMEAWGKLAGQGLLYHGLRPVYWCYHCETALADDEVEYQDKVSPTIYVAFRLLSLPQALGDLPEDAEVYVVIWTTTPWTIPGNTAIALAAGENYVVLEHEGKYYVVAEALADLTMQETGLVPYTRVATLQGRDFEGLETQHPLYDRRSKLVLADYVTMDQGTGCVHTAPGHGLEDYVTATRYGLDVISPLDDLGRFTEEAGEELAGLVCDQGNDKVIEMLERVGALVGKGRIEHSYPHCWRCHQPVIYRSTPQWFLDLDRLRERALEEIAQAEWISGWGQARIAGMVEARPDWCLSRQRSWGVPIPAFYCEDCGEVLMTEETVNFVRDLVAQEGADVWWARSVEELLPPGTTCPRCGGSNFRKETDIMSVWFDSGCSHYCVLSTHPDLGYPADLYLEGDDQYQCWFQTSLWVAVALGQRAPFRTVVGHGFFVDETGRKLSKSRGNIIDPAEIYQKYGADVLRMWFTYADFKAKMSLTEAVLNQVAEGYRRLRNVARFMLANLQDFDPSRDAVEYAELADLDRWALMRMQRVIARITAAFDRWDLHFFHHELNQFLAHEMSAFYLDVLKDTLYTELPDAAARRSAQTVLWLLLLDLTRMMAPIVPFTADEIWSHIRKLDPDLPVSVQLEDWPEPREQWIDEELEERFERFLEVRAAVTEAIEQAKAAGGLANPLEAAVR